MKFMIYLHTNINQYRKYIVENKTDRISKGIKLFTTSKDYLLSKIGINEIFDNKYGLETKYDKIKLNNNIKVTFNTKLDSYRLDIIPIVENDELINHISFTLNNDRFDNIPDNIEEFDMFSLDYETPTNKGEMVEILNRLNYILRDLVKKGLLNKFCIGGTEIQKKNDIYEYFLKVIDCDFKKINTLVYPKSGWGLYFKIK